ncbi:MAG: hypothetical protein OEX07_00520 [Gammaproteobacteria bacterium]|nr:hypothetical protein [Gammaproteobacteria bacterium]
MKTIKIKEVGNLKNELRKYTAGKKLDINQFDQMARLAWLGKLIFQPLEPTDPNCKSLMVYAEFPTEFQEHFLNTDDDLVGCMHIVDAEQGEALIKVMEQGVNERAALYADLKQRGFYFEHFYKPKPDKEE